MSNKKGHRFSRRIYSPEKLLEAQRDLGTICAAYIQGTSLVWVVFRHYKEGNTHELRFGAGSAPGGFYKFHGKWMFYCRETDKSYNQPCPIAAWFKMPMEVSVEA